MARYVQDVTLNKPDDFVHFIMNDYLQKNGFVMSDWKGEPAYRAGDPMFEGYKFLKWSYSNGHFHLEAWLKGTMGGEWDLEGFVGCAQKGPYKKNLQTLIQTLQQPLPQPGGTAFPQAAPQTGDPSAPDAQNMGYPAPMAIPVQTVDNYNAATLALVFGILSIVFCCIPLLGLIFGILGFSQARMGQGSSKASLAKAGKICCIVGLSLTACVFVCTVSSTSIRVYGS